MEPNLTASRISQRLRETKEILQDVVFNARITETLDAAEVEQTNEIDVWITTDAQRVLGRHSRARRFRGPPPIRVWKNILAPINKIPPEILPLVPNFLDPGDRDERVIALTHVCRTWREVFVSRSLWTDFGCPDEEKTRVYFERSGSSPINLSIDLDCVEKGITPCDPLFQIIPHATGRPRSLFVEGPSEDIRVITSHLSHPAPLLERLSIICRRTPHRRPIIASTLFNGDLSLLYTLRLVHVRTELPWRDMVNLTSFTLSQTSHGAISVEHFLDFFESAPSLKEVKLYSVTPITGAKNRRLVSLACLKSMDINGDSPSSGLLDHLLIPVGARLEIGVDLLSSSIREHLPRSLDNLKNFSSFTAIKLRHDIYFPHMEFSRSNGKVNITFRTSRSDLTGLVLESLRELNTSNTERLEIDSSGLPTGDPLYRALLPMKGLRVLTFSRCTNPDIFVRALQPAARSSEAVVCPKLEELDLVLNPHETIARITSAIEMAAARASRGKKLRTVRILGGCGAADLDVSELMKHVWNVEFGSVLGLGRS